MYCVGQTSVNEILGEASKLYKAKEYATALGKYKEGLKEEVTSPQHLYNGACTAALMGETETAFEWLEKAVTVGKGKVKPDYMQKDEKLAALKNEERWTALLEKAQKTIDAAEANYNKPLQAELLAILKEDQKYRMSINMLEQEGLLTEVLKDSLMQLMAKTDSSNLGKVETILMEYGWVGPDVVGKKANDALFFVIQHADIKTQKKYLPMMEEAVKNKKAKGNHLALLVDRIEIREGRKQIYGSQIGVHEETEERYILPLLEPDTVDERRAAVGLKPLADYVKVFDLEWDVETYKKRLPEYEKWAKE